MIDERGGINVKGTTYEVEVLIEDAKSTLDGVTAAANRLVYDKGVELILGPAGFFSVASSPVTTSNGVLNIISFSTGQPGELDQSTPLTFQAYDGTAASFVAGVNYVKDHYPQIKKIAVVTADEGSVPYVKPVFKDALAVAGMSLAGDFVLFPNETQDFSPMIAKYGDNTPIYLQSANFLWVLKQVVEAAQSIKTKDIKAQWEKMDKVETFFGTGIVCGDKTTGINHHVVTHPLPFQTMKNGEIVSAGFSGEVILP